MIELSVWSKLIQIKINFNTSHTHVQTICKHYANIDILSKKLTEKSKSNKVKQMQKKLKGLKIDSKWWRKIVCRLHLWKKVSTV